MAAQAKDEVMTAAYERGDDLHAITACALLGIAPDEFDKDTPEHAEGHPGGLPTSLPRRPCPSATL